MIWIKMNEGKPPVNTPLFLFVKSISDHGFEFKYIVTGEYSTYSHPSIKKKRGWRIYTLTGKKPVSKEEEKNIIAWTLSVGCPMNLLGMIDHWEHV